MIGGQQRGQQGDGEQAEQQQAEPEIGHAEQERRRSVRLAAAPEQGAGHTDRGPVEGNIHQRDQAEHDKKEQRTLRCAARGSPPQQQVAEADADRPNCQPKCAEPILVSRSGCRPSDSDGEKACDNESDRKGISEHAGNNMSGGDSKNDCQSDGTAASGSGNNNDSASGEYGPSANANERASNNASARDSKPRSTVPSLAIYRSPRRESCHYEAARRHDPPRKRHRGGQSQPMSDGPGVPGPHPGSEHAQQRIDQRE